MDITELLAQLITDVPVIAVLIYMYRETKIRSDADIAYHRGREQFWEQKYLETSDKLLKRVNGEKLSP